MAEISTYLLLVLRGLEFLVEKDVRSKLQVMQGKAAVGKIILQTKSSAAEVQELQSVQAILALLAKSNEIDTESDTGVEQIGQLLMKSDWNKAVKLWKEHAVHPVDDSMIKFRGSCVRDGKHAYNSQTVAGEVGARVVDKFGWSVDLTEFDLEVVVVIFYKFMVAGIALADPRKIQFRNRLANESRNALADSQYVSTLRPSTAYLMLQLARHRYGDVVLDSMCGIGTIPICAADFTNDGVFALGGELDELPSGKAGKNTHTRARPVDIARWDSARLPLRNHSIDRVMIDMPFGVRCGNQRQNNKMYPKVFKELLRVLRPDGRAVLLVMSKKLFKGAIKDLPFHVVGRADPVMMVELSVVLEEKHKSIDVVLQALAGAEEALDNPEVAEFFAKKPPVRLCQGCMQVEEIVMASGDSSIGANKGVRSLGGARSGRFAADMRMSAGGYGRADKTWGVDHPWHSTEEGDLFAQLCAKDRMEEGGLAHEQTVEDPVLGLSRAQLKKRKAKLKKKGLTAKQASEKALKEAEEAKRRHGEELKRQEEQLIKRKEAVKKKKEMAQEQTEDADSKREKRIKEKQKKKKEKQIDVEREEQQTKEQQEEMKTREIFAAAYEENVGNEVTTKSGLVIQDQRIGQGKLPVNGEMLTVKYRARLGRDGLVFGKGMLTMTFGTGSVIAGWEEGLATMRPGGVRLLTIPSKLGYGETGKGDKIPPNSTLFFEVELVRIGKRKRETIGEDDTPLPSSFQRKRIHQKSDRNHDQEEDNGDVKLSKSQLKRRRRNRTKHRTMKVDT